MTEEEALAWLTARPDVPRETIDRLARLAELVIAENVHQNLIARSTVDHIFARHIVDSVQLLDHAPADVVSWMDLGAGAGFPGLVVALCRPDIRVILVESRRKRIDFLQSLCAQLDLASRVEIAGTRVEMITSAPVDVISARAFAPLDKLLTLAHRFAKPNTIWVLPKGRSASNELADVNSSWQGEFRVVPSVTDPEAAIIVAANVKPKGRR